jgi:K+ transporter
VSNLKNLHKLSAAGLLISLGIIYGDIGTSPLYVFKAIVADRIITSDLILGGLSCIFWTLTLQTTIKYVIITLRADNKGEGGILSLFSLVKKKGKWLVIPAMIGGSALLADGMITPPITVSAAIEGLRIFYADIPTVPIVTCYHFITVFDTAIRDVHCGQSLWPDHVRMVYYDGSFGWLLPDSISGDSESDQSLLCLFLAFI